MNLVGLLFNSHSLVRRMPLVFFLTAASCASYADQKDVPKNSECIPSIPIHTKGFHADDRIAFNQGGAPLKAGESNELTLVLHGPPISCLGIEESGPGVDSSETSQAVSVLRRSNGSQYVRFTPVRLGRISVQLW